MMTLVWLALPTTSVYADPTAAPSLYLQGAKAGSRSDTDAITLGITSPIAWSGSVLGTQIGSYWDLSASRLSSADGGGGNSHTNFMLGLTPTFRLRFAEGRSPWFADAGIGVSATSRLYRSNAKGFSTRLNFGSHIALGYGFGPGYNQELSLRFQHFSNAGLKHPNPGENFVQLRYLHTF